MSKITDYYNLPIGSAVEEIDKECKEGEPVVFCGKVIYTVKNTYTTTSSCVNNAYHMQDAYGKIKEITAEELMSENYLVEPFKTEAEIEREKWMKMYNPSY